MQALIAINGCYFKGPYSRVLIYTVSIDGNIGLFLIAYTVVEIVSTDN